MKMVLASPLPKRALRPPILILILILIQYHCSCSQQHKGSVSEQTSPSLVSSHLPVRTDLEFENLY
jgi:hypothetical protein